MRYTETHEWIRLEGDVGTVGITDYAKAELGDIVYVELPRVGSKVKAGEEVCVLESTKAAADIYSPVTGTIVAVHEDLRSCLEKINKAPEDIGWLFRIELSEKQEFEKLLLGVQYRQFIGKEEEK